MASLTTFECFSEHLAKGLHAFGTHGIKVYLTNNAPNAASHTGKADLAGITEQNGYAPASISAGVSRSGGTTTISATDKTWTASGGSFGPFRYAVIYNDDTTSPADALIGYYDYGSSITINDGESFKVDFTEDKLMDIS